MLSGEGAGRVSRVLAVGVLVAGLALGLEAADTGHLQPRLYVPGVAHLSLVARGRDVSVELVAPAVTLLGFEHAPRTRAERERLALARQNLETGDGMIRFNTRAGCRLAEFEVDAGLGGAPHEPLADQLAAEARHAGLRARYRFECDWLERLESAALGLFVGFPSLERVLIQYVTDEGRGGAELTPRNPVVVFVPL